MSGARGPSLSPADKRVKLTYYLGFKPELQTFSGILATSGFVWVYKRTKTDNEKSEIYDKGLYTDVPTSSTTDVQLDT